MRRREFLLSLAGSGLRGADPSPGFRLTDVTKQSGIRFLHDIGPSGHKYLPETLGPGCAFLDYDGDGWQDILLINSGSSAPALYRNNRDGTFRDVTRQAGLDVRMYGLGVAVSDFDNDGFPDIYITCVGQNRLFRNKGNGTFTDITARSGLGGRQGFSSSAMWFDYDRDGLLDLFICNYVKWTPETDILCSSDRKQKSY